MNIKEQFRNETLNGFSLLLDELGLPQHLKNKLMNEIDEQYAENGTLSESFFNRLQATAHESGALPVSVNKKEYELKRIKTMTPEESYTWFKMYQLVQDTLAAKSRIMQQLEQEKLNIMQANIEIERHNRIYDTVSLQIEMLRKSIAAQEIERDAAIDEYNAYQRKWFKNKAHLDMLDSKSDKLEELVNKTQKEINHWIERRQQIGEKKKLKTFETLEDKGRRLLENETANFNEKFAKLKGQKQIGPAT